MQPVARRSPQRWERFWELLRFGAVGASSTLIFLGVYAGLVVASVPYLAAQVAAFAVSAAWGYVLHHHFTFRSGPKDLAEHGGRASRWLAVQGSALLLNMAALALLVSGIGVQEIVAQIILLPLFPLYTYALSRRHVFS